MDKTEAVEGRHGTQVLENIFAFLRSIPCPEEWVEAHWYGGTEITLPLPGTKHGRVKVERGSKPYCDNKISFEMEELPNNSDVHILYSHRGAYTEEEAIVALRWIRAIEGNIHTYCRCSLKEKMPYKYLLRRLQGWRPEEAYRGYR